MKKLIIIIVFCFFCIGCEAKYELNINKDLTVDESFTGLENEKFYNNYYKSSKERVIGFMSETKDEYLTEIGYTKELVNYADLSGAKFSHTFLNLEDYFSKSKAYTQFYERWDYSINNGVVKISLKNQLLRNEYSIDRYLIDDCDVSITLPFKVSSNNADNVNKKTNTFTWNLNDEKGKNIYIKFDTNKIYEYKENKYIDYIIISVILIVVCSIAYFIYTKCKINNKFD